MAWSAGSGISISRGTAAATEAAQEALDRLAGAPATFGVVFASPQHDLGAAVAAVASAARCPSIIGASTAGEFTDRGFRQGGVATLLVSAPGSVHAAAYTTGVRADPRGAAQRLCAGFPAAAAQATAAGLAHSTTVALIDGLAGTAEAVVKDVMTGTRPFQQLVGGAAADGAAYRETRVADPRSCGVDAAAVVHAFGSTRWGVGVDHGLLPQTPKMLVTRAEGNVVLELDHRPAFEVYRAYAKERGITLTPENTTPFLYSHELGIFFLDELRAARVPLQVTPGGGLACAAEVPKNATVAILDGEVEHMLAAASHAARAARDALASAEPAAVLVFDCVARHGILGAAFDREVEAVRQVFPGVPLAGFLTCGEIARYRGRLDGWHNTTVVVVAIPR